MDLKDGVKTTEFWLSSLTVVFMAILALLVGYGLLTKEESSMWMNLITALLALIVPVAAYYGMQKTTTTYVESRTSVKSAASEALVADAMARVAELQMQK